MSWPDERGRFPVLERFAYLNAGTFGPLSRPVLEAMAELRGWEAIHGRGGRPYFDAMRERRERVRALVAAEVKVPAANVALTDSTTRGVHIVVTGLGLGPGDDVVTTDSEHFGLIGPLAASGATLRIARVHGAPSAELVDRIRAEVTPSTRLIALSAVSWLDGTILPWSEVRTETGLPVLVDGAQSVGALDVDARAADYYTVSAQKWLCGPDATGALCVADPEALPPRLVSYAAAASTDLTAGTWEPEDGARRHDQPYTPASSLAGLEAALTGLPSGRFDRAAELTGRCRALLRERGFDVVGEDGQGTLIAFRVPGDTAAAAAALYERGVVLRDLPGTGLLRASVGWWNDENDLDRLVTGLSGL
jgi:selenocysteine lyase/cysteine desulfurase